MKANKKSTIEYSNKRNKYGVIVGIIGVLSNLLLFSLKLLAGLLSKSITFIADAVNNLSDSISAFIIIIGFKLSDRPADPEHPYGHARYEYIAGLFTAIFIIITGSFLAKTSIEKIITPTEIFISLLTFVTISLSFAIKIFLAILNRVASKKLSSIALFATAKDTRNDLVITGIVLLSIIIFSITKVNTDGVFGLIVSAAIIISGVKLLKDTISPLIGIGDQKMVSELEKSILTYPEVLGVHDVLVHSYGSSKKYATAHVEVPAHWDMLTSHALIDTIERDLSNKCNVCLSIHIDPQSNDPISLEIKNKVLSAITALDNKITMHDCRVIECIGFRKLFFDVAIPFSSKLSLKDIVSIVENSLKEDGVRYEIIVEIDKYS